VLFVANSPVSSQFLKQGSIWYVGGHAGFNFKTTPPTILRDGAINEVGSRNATITDENGNLLFYTDAKTVWNRFHQVMQNGEDINTYLGNTPRAAVIVPHPGDGQLYFVFSTSEGDDLNVRPTGMTVSVVDMSGDGGKGAVISKNARQVSWSTSMLSVGPHADERSYWVITHSFGDSNFYGFKVSESGLSAPVISNVGPAYEWNQTQLKISPDGTRLAIGYRGRMDLYDFNPATGAVTNFRGFEGIGSTGVEFSPDSELLYTSTYETKDHFGAVFQYDVGNGDPDYIRGSEVRVGMRWIGSSFGDLQLAYDGRIYVGIRYGMGSDSLIYIGNPNVRGRACGFTQRGIMPPAGFRFPFLPTSVQSYFRDSPSIKIRPGCTGVPSELRLASMGYADSVRWDFGDGASAGFAQATGRVVEHVYGQAGTYIVRVRKYIGSVFRELEETFEVGDPPVVDLGPDLSLCRGGVVTLHAGIWDTYTWSNGSDSASTELDGEGVYAVQVTRGLCKAYDEVSVAVIEYPVVDLGPDLLLCDDAAVTVGSSEPDDGTVTYHWSNGETSRMIRILDSGEYSLEAARESCKTTDAIMVDFEAITDFRIVSDTIRAIQDRPVQIESFGANIDTWRWTFGDESRTNSQGPVGVHRYLGQGIYHGTVEAFNVAGCQASISFVVDVPTYLFVPNIFSPNGDGFNDEFEIRYNGDEVPSLRVYDRWGATVFTSHAQTSKWNGGSCPAGVYFYELRIGSTDYRGWVHLLR